MVTPSYVIANFHAHKKITEEKWNMTLSVGVENIFDANYHEHLDWGEISRMGRNFIAGVNVKF